jgi:hypothetical protein
VVSDLLPESDAYRLIRSHVGTGFETRALKTSLDALTPFEQTLFMDVDTLAIGNPARAFEYLDKAPVALALDDELTIGGRLNVGITPWHVDYLGAEEIEITKRYPVDAPFYNAGVMAWTKGSASAALFAHWRKEWERFRRTDQLALARTLHDGHFPIAELPKTFNLSHTHAKATDPTTARLAGVTIVHFWLDGYKKMTAWCAQA